MADKVCGLVITYAILAALLHRERTGQGQRVEVPMVEAMRAFVLVEHAAARTALPPQGPAGYERILNPERRPQRTRDGYVSVLPYSKENYQDIFRAGGRGDLINDERIQSARSRIANAEGLYRDVAEVVAGRTTAEWLRYCKDRSIPATAVPTLDDLVDSLPQADHPVAGAYRVTPQPVRFSDFAGPAVQRPAALSGEHTQEILAELSLPDDVITAIAAAAGQSRRERKAAATQEVSP
jgi:crotonobetainyl-CoA:carnitine CoA-transferase CaiB-like acyl-CoA transferase